MGHLDPDHLSVLRLPHAGEEGIVFLTDLPRGLETLRIVTSCPPAGLEALVSHATAAMDTKILGIGIPSIKALGNGE